MSTLLLRLAAPLQSWGYDSKFERRTTGREPTKSGVIGLIAAALGRRRDESLEDLAMLKFGVRIDKPGRVLVDFHTARSTKQTYVTRRYYLEDAEFLVGLEGDAVLLRTLENAVNAPFFPLFLGRRSCPPTGRICLGIRDMSLEEALRTEPFYGKDNTYILVLDTDESGAYRQRDLPFSFSQRHRKFTYRYVTNKVIPHNSIESAVSRHETVHDAFEGVDS